VHSTRTASDQVYQLLAHGRWFSPGIPASSTTKTGRHDIAEILLKVALKHQKSNQPIANKFTELALSRYLISTDHGQATGKLDHLRCESSAPFL
jgi:hypothetical protein